MRTLKTKVTRTIELELDGQEIKTLENAKAVLREQLTEGVNFDAAVRKAIEDVLYLASTVLGSYL
jgi:hypothetical protein